MCIEVYICKQQKHKDYKRNMFYTQTEHTKPIESETGIGLVPQLQLRASGDTPYRTNTFQQLVQNGVHT